MADLFHYTDYRHFLRDYYEVCKKERGTQFSYRSFSRAAGFRSPNFLQLVIQGKRNLGVKGIEAIIRVLGLTKNQAAFFRVLVQFNQAKNSQEQKLYFEELRRFKSFREIRSLESDQYEYLSHWYHAAIRELCLLPNFKANPNWIAEQLRPNITSQMAEHSLNLLQRLGLLKENTQGSLTPADRAITTAREVQSLGVKNFHGEMLQKAKDSLEQTPAQFRDISSVTVALSQENFERAKRRIQELRRELNILFSEDQSPEVVYQLNFQIFNLSAIPWQRSQEKDAVHKISARRGRNP